MATRQAINIPGLTHNVPIPNGALVGSLFMTGSITVNDPDGGPKPEDSEGEFRRLFSNAELMLNAAGGSFDDVVKMDIYVKDRGIRSVLDPIWVEMFPDADDRPARHVIVSDQERPTMELTAFIGS
jgi:2-iminobutanoate/2-iminopropanoate deaminase